MENSWNFRGTCAVSKHAWNMAGHTSHMSFQQLNLHPWARYLDANEEKFFKRLPGKRFRLPSWIFIVLTGFLAVVIGFVASPGIATFS